MPNPRVNYDSASPYLQHWAGYFVQRYPNQFDYWELVNAVWVDEHYHKRVLTDPRYIKRISYSCMTHYIESILRRRRKYQILTNHDIEISLHEYEQDEDIVSRTVDIFMENNNL